MADSKVIITLLRRYGPVIASEVGQWLKKITPAQRQRVLDVLQANNPRHRLRRRIKELTDALEARPTESEDPERRQDVPEWLRHLKQLDDKLNVAEALPKTAKATALQAISDELDGLVRDLLSREAGTHSPTLPGANKRRFWR